MLQEQVMYNLIECNNDGAVDVVTFTILDCAKSNLLQQADFAIKKAKESNNYLALEKTEDSYKIFYKDNTWLQFKVISCNLYSF